VVVGRNGKIEIQTSDLAGGIIVEVIVLVKQDVLETNTNPSIAILFELCLKSLIKREHRNSPPQTPRARWARGGGIWGNTSGRFISVLKCYNLFRIAIFNKMKQSICRLLKLIVNLMAAIQNIQTKTNLVSFTHEEWNEEYNITRK
jgi:antitoxin YefM